MQLTVELDADLVAHLAHLADMLDIARKQDVARMHSVYPLHIVMAMNCLIDSFAELLAEMDSPFQIGLDVSQDASILAYRMKDIGESMLEMKADFKALQAKNKKREGE